jgi:hypothetical protein
MLVSIFSEKPGCFRRKVLMCHLLITGKGMVAW